MPVFSDSYGEQFADGAAIPVRYPLVYAGVCWSRPAVFVNPLGVSYKPLWVARATDCPSVLISTKQAYCLIINLVSRCVFCLKGIYFVVCASDPKIATTGSHDEFAKHGASVHPPRLQEDS